MMDMRWATPGHEPAKPRAVITFARIGVGIFFVLAAALLIASAAQGHFYRATLPLSQGYFDIGVFKVKAHIDPIGEPPQDMTFNVNSKCELIPAGAAGAAGATAKLPGCSLYKGTIVISMATAALACLCVLIAASGFALQRHVKYSQVVNVFAVLLFIFSTLSAGVMAQYRWVLADGVEFPTPLPITLSYGAGASFSVAIAGFAMSIPALFLAAYAHVQGAADHKVSQGLIV